MSVCNKSTAGYRYINIQTCDINNSSLGISSYVFKFVFQKMNRRVESLLNHFMPHQTAIYQDFMCIALPVHGFSLAICWGQLDYLVDTITLHMIFSCKGYDSVPFLVMYQPQHESIQAPMCIFSYVPVTCLTIMCIKC